MYAWSKTERNSVYNVRVLPQIESERKKVGSVEGAMEFLVCTFLMVTKEETCKCILSVIIETFSG